MLSEGPENVTALPPATIAIARFIQEGGERFLHL